MATVCAKVRKFLEANSIAYADLDIENNAKARDYELATLKTDGYPLTVVCREVLAGWNEKLLTEAVHRL